MFKIKVPAGLVSLEAPLGFQVLAFLLYPHLVFALCMHIPGVTSSSYKDTSHIGLGPHPYDLI